MTQPTLTGAAHTGGALEKAASPTRRRRGLLQCPSGVSRAGECRLRHTSLLFVKR